MLDSGSGEIEFEEFAAMVATFVNSGENAAKLDEELREAFRLYDKEGNGYISTTVLRDILAAIDETITDEELDEMIMEIDADGSGTVDFDGESHHTFWPYNLPYVYRIQGDDERRVNGRS
jgi:Ca2+-binding EF-hand superfamily protein